MFESDADREAMLRGLGGSSVTGPGGRLTGVLEREYLPVGDEAAVDSSEPRLIVRTDEARRAGIGHGAVLTIEGETYIVRSVQPDGTGRMTTCTLEAI
jgi:hypothetical protein